MILAIVLHSAIVAGGGAAATYLLTWAIVDELVQHELGLDMQPRAFAHALQPARNAGGIYNPTVALLTYNEPPSETWLIHARPPVTALSAFATAIVSVPVQGDVMVGGCPGCPVDPRWLDAPRVIPPRWSRASVAPGPGQWDTHAVTEVRAGFPLQCLQMSVVEVTPHHGTNHRWAPTPRRLWAVLSRTPGPSQIDLLPTRPVWPLFIANVILLGCVLDRMVFWGFVPAVRGSVAYRHRRRRNSRLRRGLCPHCAYPIDKSRPAGSVCPECGKGAEPAR